MATTPVHSKYNLAIRQRVAKRQIPGYTVSSLIIFQDGTFLHFLYDVVRFTYTQTHYCGKNTNKGFAFNEGWAEFWAGSCYNTYGNSPTDYTREGNVAKALRALRNRCGSSDGQMVDVLQRNQGSVHSYDQYAAAHNKLYGCM